MTDHVNFFSSYGVQGYEVIYQTLHRMFLSGGSMELISNLAQPLPPEYFLHKVLVPETSLGLIAEDINKPISDPIVGEKLEKSRTYGAALFPDGDEWIIYILKYEYLNCKTSTIFPKILSFSQYMFSFLFPCCGGAWVVL